jgi:alcohol dehydrogenase, propanol-preferring
MKAGAPRGAVDSVPTGRASSRAGRDDRGSVAGGFRRGAVADGTGEYIGGMRAMILERAGELRAGTRAVAAPARDELLLRVRACGVCRTDLHILDGELAEPKLPLVPGHQIVGVVEARGAQATHVAVGARVGVPWLGWTCGECRYCTAGRENLCAGARFTGYHIDGGFAEYCVADHRFCFPLPDDYPDLQAAPLLCAGLIGYRSLRMTADAECIGFYGFGAAAHILIQLARWQGRRIYAFTRPGDAAGQRFALELGAEWAGDAGAVPPVPLDAAILFAPAGELVPVALRAVVRGGTVVCGGIHMSDIPAFPYELLWGERVIRSVANLTRRDGEEFLAAAPAVPIRTHVEAFPLEETLRALQALREGRIRGAAVVVP